jgi:hypothetical protein
MRALAILVVVGSAVDALSLRKGRKLSSWKMKHAWVGFFDGIDGPFLGLTFFNFENHYHRNW